MRVLHVMEATIGGTRRHIVDVGLGQRAAGLDVHLVLARERQADFVEDMQVLERAGCRVVHLPMVRPIRPQIDLRHLLRLKSILREVRPDIVHTHSSKAGVLGRHASLSTGIGMRVHTPHTFSFLFGAMFGSWKRRFFRALERHYGRRTERMIAVSATEGETIRNAGVIAPERVRVVPNGIDPAPWSNVEPADRAALGVPLGVPMGAVVGLLNPAKGQDIAIEALAHMSADMHLVVVGHGEDLADLQALARRVNVAERVHFLGWRRDVPAILAAADMLVLPSRWEGLPYVVLEAMAAGLPVVATRVDGARELVIDGESGWLVEPEDADALAAALDRAVAAGPDGRRALGAHGRQRMGERYSQEAMVCGLTGVYRECLG